jgi:tetratricopeptide (TPR) repeat protein
MAEGLKVSRNRLCHIATTALLTRDIEALRAATDVLVELEALDQLDGGARYFESCCLKLQGRLDDACKILESVVETNAAFRSRALHTLGWIHFERGQADAALPFYAAAARASGNRHPLVLAQSQRMTAVVRALHGDHFGALEKLERLSPLIHAVGRYYPSAYYEYLNSLAVELGEVGRIAEAKAASSLAVASPYAAAYPGWVETKIELDEKQPEKTVCLIAIDRIPERIQPEPGRVARALSRPTCSRHCPPLQYIIASQRSTGSELSRQRRPDRSQPSKSVVLSRIFNSFAPRGPPGFLHAA